MDYDLETIIENMTEALFIVDDKGRFIKMNAQMRKQQNLTEKPTLLGNNFDSMVYLDLDGNKIDRDDLPVSHALRGETVRDYRMAIKSPNGDMVVELNACPIFDEKGKVKMAVLCSRDITQVVEDERLKDDFLSIISHEFKTPITVILSIIQTMELVCRNELPVKVKAYIKQIRQNSLRQLRLVNNLLDVTRVNAGRIVLHNRNHNMVFHTRLIVDSVQAYAAGRGIDLTFKTSVKEKIVGIDEEKFERILLNLLSNAIKFTPKDKCVIVELTTQKGWVCVRVIDQGIGIPENMREIIFERFGQVSSSLSRQAEGSGIGLSLVKMLVELMGGRISVESSVGKGSTFTVLLPSGKVKDIVPEKTGQVHDDRLINTIAIEFSDMYL